ncbi:MAG: hypothetical protein AAGA46_14135 [Cyanobacteria bacterium P01_F01_bin.13]
MAAATFTYESIWRDSQRGNWRVRDLIGPDKPMDFRRPFLPDSIARVADINGNVFATQALLGFAEEEGKHIYMFQEFMAAFKRGFHHRCDCVGPLEELAQTILAYPPLSVLLLTLQFEWTTQIHYLESVRHQSESLDPCFCDLLKYHWMEEAQHTKLDALLAYELVQLMPADAVETAIEGYFELVQLLEQTLMTQVKLDIDSLMQAMARTLNKADQGHLQSAQAQAYRWSFLCAGVGHPNFIGVLDQISPAAKQRAISLAKVLSH